MQLRTFDGLRPAPVVRHRRPSNLVHRAADETCSQPLRALQAGTAALEAPLFQPRQQCRTLIVAQRKVKKTQQVILSVRQTPPPLTSGLDCIADLNGRSARPGLSLNNLSSYNGVLSLSPTYWPTSLWQHSARGAWCGR